MLASSNHLLEDKKNMVRRLKFQNKKDRKGAFQRPVRHVNEVPRSDGFSMKFSGGQGVLELVNESLEGGIKLERIELVIDNISFPFDISQGIRGLSNRRLKLQKIELEIPLEAVLSHVSKRVEGNDWVHDFEAAFFDNYISVSLRYGPTETAVPVSFRWIPVTWKNALAFVVDEIRCYGALPGPMFSIAVLCSAELTGFGMDGGFVVLDNPIKQVLLAALPKRGWRLPAYDDVCVEGFVLHPRRCALSYGLRSTYAGQKDALEQLLSMPMLKRLEELRGMRDADYFISKGELEEARVQLSTMLERTPDSAAVLTRLAMIDVLNPALRNTEIQLLIDNLSQWQNRTDALAVIAHGAALDGDTARELWALEKLFPQSAPLEKLQGAIRIGELLSETDAPKAISFLEQAVSVRRDNAEALLLLMDLYALQSDVPKLQSLIPRWIAIHKDPVEQVQASIQAGRVLLAVSQWAEAAKYFERALIGAPDNEDAAWGVAAALAGQGEVQRAVSSYEKLAAACGQKGDTASEAEALGAIGEVWIKQGEPELAIPRLQDALTVQYSSDVQLLLAAAQVALGRIDQAVMNYEEALETAPQHDKDWGTSALTLARLFFSHLEDFDAANHWIDQAAKCDASKEAAYELKIQVLEKQQKWSDVAVVLEKSVVRDGREVSVETVAKLARARVAAGEIASAISTLESALSQHTDHGLLLDVYVDAVRKKGDVRKLDDALQRRFQSLPPGDQRLRVAIELGDLQLYEFEDPAMSEQWYRDALKEDETSISAREGLVEALRRVGAPTLEGEIDKLLQLYQANDEKDKVADTLFTLAEYQIGTGRGKSAATLLRKALPDLGDKRRNDALLKIADVLLAEEEFALAKDMYATVRKAKGQKDNYTAALGEAKAALATQDYADAYNAAIAAGSGPAKLRVEAVQILAEASIYTGKVNEALEILRRVGQNVPTEDAVALLDLGAELAWKEVKDIPLARKMFEEILELVPQSERAKNRLLSLLEFSGNRAELARALVRFFSAQDPGASDIKRAADFFFAEGLFAEAADALQMAYKAFPDVEVARMLATALSRSGQQEQMLSVLSEIAHDDEHARNMLLEYHKSQGDSEAMVALLSGAKSSSKEKERQRLRQLAQLTLDKGDDLVAAGYLLDAAETTNDESILRKLFEQVTSIAVTKQHPQLFARVVDGMRSIASAKEAAEMRLDLAIMYHRAKLSEESSLLLEADDALRAVSIERLLTAVDENKEMLPLISKVTMFAYEQGRWEDVERLISLQLEKAREGKKFELLRKRAGVREIRLNNRNGAAQDWMELFRAGQTNELELEQLEELLESLGYQEDLLHVLIRRAKSLDYEWEMVLKTATLAAQLGQRPLEKQFLRMAFERNPSSNVALALFNVLTFPKDRDEMKRLFPFFEKHVVSLPKAQQKSVYEVQLEVLGTEDRSVWAEILMQLIGLFPDETSYFERLMSTLKEAAEWPLLVKCLERCTELDLSGDTQVKIWVELGALYHNKLGDDERASICYRKSFSLSKNNMPSILYLAERAFAAKDWDGLGIVLSSTESTRWHPDITYWKAMLFEREDRVQEAFALFEELVDKVPQYKDAFEGYLRLAPDEGYEEGIREALAVINRKGGFAQMSPSMHRKAAKAYFVVDEIDKSQRHLELALSLEPLDKSSMVLLEKVYQRTGQTSARAYTLEKIAHMAEGDERIDYFVASARLFLNSLGDAAKAASLFTSAAKISNNEPDVLMGLADCAWANRQWANVTANLERVRLVAPHLNFDSVRMYQFAFALSKTSEWPIADIVELLERTIPQLEGKPLDDAQKLHKQLATDMKLRTKR